MSKNKKEDLDRSLDLEAEVGDDAAAYKEGDKLAKELLEESDVESIFDDYDDDDGTCIACGEMLDRYGACPNCDAIEFEFDDEPED